jgi:hypothetical protein
MPFLPTPAAGASAPVLPTRVLTVRDPTRVLTVRDPTRGPVGLGPDPTARTQLTRGQFYTD